MKALWAFEPFHQDKIRNKGIYNLLKQFVGSKSSDIEVGFVVTRKEPSLSLAYDVPSFDRFSLLPRQLTKRALQKANVAIQDKNIHIIDYETSSNTKAVDRLLDLAKSKGSDLIGLYTHGRKGILRFTMGSFAETVIHRSKLNLLLVSPKTKFPAKIKNILYASDFGAATKSHFKKIMQFCKQLNSDIVVFHQADIIYKWSLDESNPKILAYRRKVDRMKTWIEQECQRAGISVKVIVASEFKATPDLIFANVKKKKIDLVAVSAKAGPMAALMGGSITRQIVRSSKVPVLVLK